jgi:hypothetical protein
LEGSEVLTAIAEVAAAFAGFAGIVAAFRHRDLAAWPPHETFRFRFMVLYSVLTVLFALLPFFLFHFGVSPARIWSSASILLALVAFILFVDALLHYRALGDDAKSSLSLGMVYFLETGNVLVGGTQGCNAVGVGAAPSFSLYLLGLGWFLLAAAGMFVRLLLLVAASNGPTSRRK